MNIRSTGRSYANVVVPLALLSGWLLQSDPGTNPGQEFLFGNLLINAIAGAVATLIVGGLLLAIGPDYTARNTNRVLRRPGRTFAYGFGIFASFLIIIVLLFITIIGIIVAIPLLILGVVVSMIWSQIGYLAVGRLVVDDKWPALGAAVVLAFLVGLVPLIGGLVGFVVASMGMGAGFIDWRSDPGQPRQRQSQARRGPDRSSGRRSRRADRGGGADARRGANSRGRRSRQPTDPDEWGDDDRWGDQRGGDRETEYGAAGGQDGGGSARSGRRSDTGSDSGWDSGSESGSDWDHRDESSGTDTESDSEWGFDDDETWDQSSEEAEWSSGDEDDDSGWL